MDNNTNWGESVAGIVIRDGKVLLARHTYGNENGMLIIPGGFVEFGETPQDALKREFLEETGINIEPKRIIGVRFNMHDWYIVFEAEYISGEAVSDNNENSEVVWVDVAEAIKRDDVPELTKTLLSHVSDNNDGLVYTPYNGKGKNAPYSLWCV